MCVVKDLTGIYALTVERFCMFDFVLLTLVKKKKLKVKPVHL